MSWGRLPRTVIFFSAEETLNPVSIKKLKKKKKKRQSYSIPYMRYTLLICLQHSAKTSFLVVWSCTSVFTYTVTWETAPSRSQESHMCKYWSLWVQNCVKKWFKDNLSEVTFKTHLFQSQLRFIMVFLGVMGSKC